MYWICRQFQVNVTSILSVKFNLKTICITLLLNCSTFNASQCRRQGEGLREISPGGTLRGVAKSCFKFNRIAWFLGLILGWIPGLNLSLGWKPRLKIVSNLALTLKNPTLRVGPPFFIFFIPEHNPNLTLTWMKPYFQPGFSAQAEI